MEHTTSFEDLSEVVVPHNLGIVPSRCDCFDTTGHSVAAADVSSVSHTTTQTTVTFTGAKSGSITVRVDEDRHGTLRYSPDGSQWAIVIDDEGVISTVKVSA
jgi:hypothetical protein